MSFLEDIVRRQREMMVQSGHPLVRIESTSELKKLAERCEKPEGKTIGIKVPSDLRARLEGVKARLGLRTYKQTVLMAIEVGVVLLEQLAPQQPEEK